MTRVSRYRLIIQGEGVRPDGEWFGFYAARDEDASSESEAATQALASFNGAWSAEQSAELGELRTSAVAVCWQPKHTLGLINRGVTLYDDNSEAQQEAWRLESEAAEAPASVRELRE